MNCPAEADLLLIALETRRPAPDAILHLRGCERCRSRVEAMYRAAGAVEAVADQASVDRSRCLDEIGLSELAAGANGGRERMAALEHVAACDHCRGRYAELIRLLGAPEVEAAVRRL